mgnify:CR=1 FL=1
MNFEELKNQWYQESVPDQAIPQLERSLKRAGNAIDKVRSNMRMDFYGFILIFSIGLLALFIVPRFIFVHQILQFIIWSFFVTFSTLAGYFLFKFYRFYKKSYTLSYSLKDNLWWFYYELKSFVDFYYTFNIVSLTMGFSCGLSLGYIGANLKMMQNEENVISKSMDQLGAYGFVFLLIMVFVVICFMIGLHYAVKFMYGKHLLQLKRTLDLLREG